MHVPAPVLAVRSADSRVGRQPQLVPPCKPATQSVAGQQPLPPEKDAMGLLHERWLRPSDHARPHEPTDSELQLGPKSVRDPPALSGHCHLLLRGMLCCLAPRIPVGCNTDGGAH
ncbi:hypothetical protein NDU88_001837 [Pleurodeles waltl]|uniref:Uncharacterized protein n=1 Tax=Pleurodeles waltl TaxID=8319 RepID=A0AAV7U8S1_PLEWA|nr:hypothetical protein NDU88_001837 [Pleurodeles waltl]